MGIAIAASFGVELSIVRTGLIDWSTVVSVGAAVVAVGAHAVRLGVPRRYVWQSAVLGAVSWVLFVLIAGGQRLLDPGLATFGAAVLIGTVGRLLARRYEAPPALWAVPAILPLLPGLQIVQALLAQTDAARLTGLLAAAGTAFLVGTGVASGDIIVATALRVRQRLVDPAVGAVAGGVDAVAGGVDEFLVTPVERAVERRRIRPG
jgi:uncharacterized membrane protein YjjB (DUF3815 family)